LFTVFYLLGVFRDSIFIKPDQPLTIVEILFASTFPILIASCVFYLFERYSEYGFHSFRILSLILLIFSFINPFIGIEGVTVAYALVLNSMHVVVVGSLLVFVGRADKKAKA